MSAAKSTVTSPAWTPKRPDDGALEAQRASVDLDRLGPREAARAEEDIDAQISEACGGVVARDGGALRTHAVHERREVDRDLAGVDSEAPGAARVVGGTGRADQRLRGHAAGDEAVAAEQVLLDERHPRADPRCASGGDQACGPAAEDDEVVAVLWGRVLPIGRVDLAGEFLVRGAEGLQLGKVLDLSVGPRWGSGRRSVGGGRVAHLFSRRVRFDRVRVRCLCAAHRSPSA
ncbi:MAG: hypothetical protein AAFP22_09460 [Planctomycetota bacterium]